VANRVTDVCDESVIHGTLRKYQGSRLDVSVCSGGTSSDLTSIKEAVFCNFDLT